MSGAGGFKAEVYPSSVSSNYARLPTLTPSETGPPYSNPTRSILYQIIQARDEVMAVKSELVELSRPDIGKLLPRP